MTDQIVFPPLHDPAPGEIARRKHHLLSEIAPEGARRLSLPSVRLIPFRVALPAAAAICIAAAFAIVAVWPGGSTPHAGHPGRGGADPIHSVPPVPTTLSDASAAIGAPVVLPNTSLVNPADAENVLKECASATNNVCVAWGVGVTFPDQGVTVRYRQVAYGDPPSTFTDPPSNGEIIQLVGSPALLIPWVADDPGTATDIEFNLNGLTIAVTGHYDPAMLEPVAQSIIEQTRASQP